MATIGEGLASAGKSISEGIKEGGKRSRLKDMLELAKAGKLEEAAGLARDKDEILDTIALKKALEGDEEKYTMYNEDMSLSKDPIKVKKIDARPEWKPDDDRKANREELKLKNDRLNRGASLRKEFNAEQMYKNANIIKYGYNAMQKAYDLSTRPDNESRIASDQILGVLIQKMMDPTSVVRESEYARTPEGAAFMHRIENLIPKLQKGGMALADSDRKALLDGAKLLLDSSNDMLQGHVSRYVDLANMNDTDPELVVGKELLGSIKSDQAKGASDTDINQKIADYGNKLLEQGVPKDQAKIAMANFAKKVRALPVGASNGQQQ